MAFMEAASLHNGLVTIELDVVSNIITRVRYKNLGVRPTRVQLFLNNNKGPDKFSVAIPVNTQLTIANVPPQFSGHTWEEVGFGVADE
jgi:hypothetical protein